MSVEPRRETVETCPRCAAGMEWRHGTWQCARCRFKVGCCEGETGDCRPRARSLAPVTEKYTETALHFEAASLPRLLETHLPAGPLALADLGCGDGPSSPPSLGTGFISPERPVYAVDLEATRLARVSARFPWIETVVASADDVPAIEDGSLDAVLSTMVLEHVPDERAYLSEIRRVLRPGGRAYVTTVFKKPWAWYFRKRDGESVLDTSHLREYTDLGVVRRAHPRRRPPRARARAPPPLVPAPRSAALQDRRSRAGARAAAGSPAGAPGREGADPGLLRARGRPRAPVA